MLASLSRSSSRVLAVVSSSSARALPLRAPAAAALLLLLLRRGSNDSRTSSTRAMAGGPTGENKAGSTDPSAATGMEVEVKLRLRDKEAHDAVAAALSSENQIATHQQENFFLDGPHKELSSKLAVLRIRFYDVDKRALVTLKGKQKLVDGVGRGTEVEFDFPDAKAARKFVVDDMNSIYSSPSPSSSAFLEEAPQDNAVLKSLREVYQVKELVCIGGFKNVRKEFRFEGHTLELDETRFEHGTVFEIEVESSDPEPLKVKLEAFLKEKGIEYEYSATTKFANFINKTLL